MAPEGSRYQMPSCHLCSAAARHQPVRRSRCPLRIHDRPLHVGGRRRLSRRGGAARVGRRLRSRLGGHRCWFSGVQHRTTGHRPITGRKEKGPLEFVRPEIVDDVCLGMQGLIACEEGNRNPEARARNQASEARLGGSDERSATMPTVGDHPFCSKHAMAAGRRSEAFERTAGDVGSARSHCTRSGTSLAFRGSAARLS